MPNLERAARLSASLARGFGEAFTFTARKIAGNDVDLPKTADTSRSAFNAVGVWAAGSTTRLPRGRGGQADDRAQAVVASAPRASFEEATLVWVPVEGDLCQRNDTAETFAVARTIPDGFGRTLIYFTAHKRAFPIAAVDYAIADFGAPQQSGLLALFEDI